ncbi:MAG: hypothetical protein U9Q99_02920, partial [Nanoarchaeota archaeon]|nr:hypothetical protein [Nanoarchaeota archaeon]
GGSGGLGIGGVNVQGVGNGPVGDVGVGDEIGSHTYEESKAYATNACANNDAANPDVSYSLYEIGCSDGSTIFYCSFKLPSWAEESTCDSVAGGLQEKGKDINSIPYYSDIRPTKNRFGQRVGMAIPNSFKGNLSSYYESRCQKDCGPSADCELNQVFCAEYNPESIRSTSTVTFYYCGKTFIAGESIPEFCERMGKLKTDWLGDYYYHGKPQKLDVEEDVNRGWFSGLFKKSVEENPSESGSIFGASFEEDELKEDKKKFSFFGLFKN